MSCLTLEAKDPGTTRDIYLKDLFSGLILNGIFVAILAFVSTPVKITVTRRNTKAPAYARRKIKVPLIDKSNQILYLVKNNKDTRIKSLFV
jgi:hypothetical protein